MCLPTMENVEKCVNNIHDNIVQDGQEIIVGYTPTLGIGI